MNALRLVVSRNGQRPEWVALPDGVLPADLAVAAGEPKADGCLELLAVIDGVAQFYAWGGLGRVPDELLKPDLPLIPPADGSAVNRAVQRCGCGDVGCGNVTVTIRRTGDVVEWADARDRDKPIDGIGPFRFDAEQYEAEVRRAHRERDWETREERIARLVTEACRSERKGRPLSFGWASGREGRVTVYVQEWRPNPRAGETTEYPDGTVVFEDDELWDNHLGHFEIGDLDDEAAVENILGRMRSTPPARWRRPPDWPYG